MKVRCFRNIWRGFRPQQCTRTGTLEYGGKWWCKQHHPPTKDARTEERKTRRGEQVDAKPHAEREASIANVHDLLAVVEEAIALYGTPGGPWNVPGDPGGWIARAQAAVAKARGTMSSMSSERSEGER